MLDIAIIPNETMALIREMDNEDTLNVFYDRIIYGTDLQKR